jgi:hypothetical protein
MFCVEFCLIDNQDDRVIPMVAMLSPLKWATLSHILEPVASCLPLTARREQAAAVNAAIRDVTTAVAGVTHGT